MKDTDLIKSCKKGEHKAYELLVHKYSPVLFAICKRYVNDDAKAKDALQECFISVFKGIDTFKNGGNFQGWIKRIAVTSSLKQLRKERKNVFSFSSLKNDDSTFFKEEPIAIEILKLEEVLKIINQLPDDYRIAFNLFIIEGYSHNEIAVIENIAETVSRTRVRRARIKVQELLLKNEMYYEITSARKVD